MPKNLRGAAAQLEHQKKLYERELKRQPKPTLLESVSNWLGFSKPKPSEAMKKRERRLEKAVEDYPTPTDILWTNNRTNTETSFLRNWWNAITFQCDKSTDFDFECSSFFGCTNLTPAKITESGDHVCEGDKMFSKKEFYYVTKEQMEKGTMQDVRIVNPLNETELELYCKTNKKASALEASWVDSHSLDFSPPNHKGCCEKDRTRVVLGSIATGDGTAPPQVNCGLYLFFTYATLVSIAAYYAYKHREAIKGKWNSCKDSFTGFASCFYGAADAEEKASMEPLLPKV